MDDEPTAYTLRDAGGILDEVRRLAHRKNRSRDPKEETTIRKELLMAAERWVQEENDRLDEKERGL